uniref:Uncharacterized protein n=1 Tax=Eutreptiella gymnastica TaxID=73025 RepID=A0A7S1IAI8_9EUGL|mmetsp:Transcript_142991/g.249539  ORF Transcript_142991/g.249539 Transcript_142991/m.249539 type:complete len:625 (+) Transcript_142991:892-2766(+)
MKDDDVTELKAKHETDDLPAAANMDTQRVDDQQNQLLRMMEAEYKEKMQLKDAEIEEEKTRMEAYRQKWKAKEKDLLLANAKLTEAAGKLKRRSEILEKKLAARDIEMERQTGFFRKHIDRMNEGTGEKETLIDEQQQKIRDLENIIADQKAVAAKRGDGTHLQMMNNLKLQLKEAEQKIQVLEIEKEHVEDEMAKLQEDLHAKRLALEQEATELRTKASHGDQEQHIIAIHELERELTSMKDQLRALEVNKLQETKKLDEAKMFAQTKEKKLQSAIDDRERLQHELVEVKKAFQIEQQQLHGQIRELQMGLAKHGASASRPDGSPKHSSMPGSPLLAIKDLKDVAVQCNVGSSKRRKATRRDEASDLESSLVSAVSLVGLQKQMEADSDTHYDAVGAPMNIDAERGASPVAGKPIDRLALTPISWVSTPSDSPTCSLVSGIRHPTFPSAAFARSPTNNPASIMMKLKALQDEQRALLDSQKVDRRQDGLLSPDSSLSHVTGLAVLAGQTLHQGTNALLELVDSLGGDTRLIRTTSKLKYHRAGDKSSTADSDAFRNSSQDPFIDVRKVGPRPSAGLPNVRSNQKLPRPQSATALVHTGMWADESKLGRPNPIRSFPQRPTDPT